MNSAEEIILSKELVRSKARVFRFSVVIEKDRDGYFAVSPELQGQLLHRATPTKRPWRTLGMPYAFAWRIGWKPAKRFLDQNLSAQLAGSYGMTNKLPRVSAAEAAWMIEN